MQPDFFGQKPRQYTSLDELVDTMMKMEDDPLFPAGTNMVIYRGNPEAKLMVIGEAPGTEEDRLGKPFVGRSGQLLDQILGAVNFDPEKDVFITNAVFRLPPGDGGKPLRKPTPDEITFYKPFLLEIIRLVDPVIMLLSGNIATYFCTSEGEVFDIIPGLVSPGEFRVRTALALDLYAKLALTSDPKALVARYHALRKTSAKTVNAPPPAPRKSKPRRDAGN